MAITLDHGGTLNLELHCDIAPQTCDNFIRSGIASRAEMLLWLLV